MATRLSRRKLAEYAAEQLVSGNREVLRELAAYLVDEKRVSEVELLVRDIESQLADKGELIARVQTAHAIDTKQLTQYIRQITDATSVHVVSTVDPALIGGIKIDLPDSSLDTTVKRKLTALRSKA